MLEAIWVYCKNMQNLENLDRFEILITQKLLLSDLLSNLISKIIFFILSADTKYYLFCWKKNIFLRFCLCIFESDTVKSDCPKQEN